MLLLLGDIVLVQLIKESDEWLVYAHFRDVQKRFLRTAPNGKTSVRAYRDSEENRKGEKWDGGRARNKVAICIKNTEKYC